MICQYLIANHADQCEAEKRRKPGAGQGAKTSVGAGFLTSGHSWYQGMRGKFALTQLDYGINPYNSEIMGATCMQNCSPESETFNKTKT